MNHVSFTPYGQLSVLALHFITQVLFFLVSICYGIDLLRCKVVAVVLLNFSFFLLVCTVTIPHIQIKLKPF